jgi:hypothetical protein
MDIQGINSKADVYLGLLSPGGDISYTWAKRGDSYELARGMAPVLENVELSETARINVASIIKQNLDYKFGTGEAVGMYSAFALVVAADSDPSAPQNWLVIDVQPLFVQ